MPCLLYFVCKKNQQHVNRKTLIKKKNILINLEEKKLLKINKNQIRIMFVIKKKLLILEIESLIFENFLFPL